MATLYFDRRGFVMFLVAFGGAWGVLRAFERHDEEGLLMMIAGPALASMDLAYRRAMGSPLWRGVGGRILFLPAWLWGVFWTILGAGYFYVRDA
jgi:hypothetical protein